MALKRKRSASELCSSPSSSLSSSSSVLSSPPSAIPLAMDVAPHPFSVAGTSTPAHLHSRTRKRFRDSRPSDEEVHQRTLNLLFGAQQQPQRQLPQLSDLPPSPLPVSPNAMDTTAADQQQSLHRFWNISSPPSAAPGAGSPRIVTDGPTTCQDCGAVLGGDDGQMDIDSSEPDGFGFLDRACEACGKHVCFSCSVSNLGEQKRCLQCAGRKVWVGGVGWTNAPVSVC